MVEKYLTENPSIEIDNTVAKLNPDKVLVITDKNVEKKVLPKLYNSETIKNGALISILPGEEGKNIKTVIDIWQKLEEIGATRRSVVINVGGGVVTDLGGFAAATFKRGLRTINFPTTLLGAVDAATGGKTGINFQGLKNEVGAFHMPFKVIISAEPFSTLPKEEILSGYAEMVKTALISDRNFYISLLDMDNLINDYSKLGEAVAKCVEIKEDIVRQDPQESGLRKILNFGHTAGHAFESFRIDINNPVTHGKSVAHGILVALILSHLKLGFKSDEVNFYSDFLKKYYGSSLISCKDVEAIINKMNRDKKNKRYGQPSFTLLKEIGVPEIDLMPSQTEINGALEVYVDKMT